MWEPISAIVLAGGKSSRMGRDKAALTLDQQFTLIQQVAETLCRLTDDAIAVTAGQTYPGLRLRWAQDTYPGAGPLGGIVAGLSAARASHALVVACDMPFLNVALLEHMLQVPRTYDALVPRLAVGLEPLHAIYSKECLVPMEQMLTAGRFSVLDLFKLVDVRYMGEEEIGRFDARHLSFFNINTPGQFERAREMLSEVVR